MDNRNRMLHTLAEFQRRAAVLINETSAELLAIYSSPEVAPRDPWVALKEAARRVGKSEKVVWGLAQRTPGASWLHGGRRIVNLDKLPIHRAPGA